MQIQERQEPLLQPAAGMAGCFAAALETEPDRPVAAMAWVSLEHVEQRQAVMEAQIFGLAERALDYLRRDCGEIEDRARNRGDGNPALDSDLVGGQDGDVPMHLPVRAALRRHRHVKSPTSRGPDPPKRRGGMVAQDGTRPRGENGGEPPSLSGHHLVPYRVDARVEPVEAPRPQSAADSARSKAAINQLGAGHDPMLLPSQPPKPAIDAGIRPGAIASLLQCPHSGHKDGLTAESPP